MLVTVHITVTFREALNFLSVLSQLSKLVAFLYSCKQVSFFMQLWNHHSFNMSYQNFKERKVATYFAIHCNSCHEHQLYIWCSQWIYTVCLQVIDLLYIDVSNGLATFQRASWFVSTYQFIYGFFNLDFFSGEFLSFCLWELSHRS